MLKIVNLLLRLRLIYILLTVIAVFTASAQSKLGVTITNPGDIHLCIESDFITIEVRNISASTVTGIETKVVLPSGMTYVTGSVTGSGVTEKDTSNLSQPIFNVSNLSITQARELKIKVRTACSISSFLNSGGLAIIRTTTAYSGGSVSANGNVLNIKQASLVVQSITNQLKVAYKYEKFERQIAVKNTGSGKLTSLTFSRTYNTGQVLFVTSGGSISTTGTTTTSILDTTDFKTIGNNDIYLDLNETYIFIDSIQVIACSNLNATYSLSWGCYGSTCKTTSAAANTTLNNIIPALTITPTSNTTSCLSDSIEHDQQLVIYSSGNDTARDIDLNVFQSYGAGYYQYSISQILTGTFTIQKGVNDSAQSITPYQTSSTISTGVYSCLGANAKGQAFLKLKSLAPGDTLIIKWKTKSCSPDICNVGTLYNQRWKYKATYKNQCGSTINYNETYGSYGTYQSFQMQKLIPTDILSNETKVLEFTISYGYLLGVSAKSQLQVQLRLPSLLDHSLTAADLRFEHTDGTSWSPTRIIQKSDTVIAFFNGVPQVTLSRSELLIKVTGICGSATTSQTQNLKLDISYNPDTTCNPESTLLIYCTDDDIKIHCATGCSTGLHFNSFTAKRISYGQPDNNSDGIADATGSLDYNKIKLNRIMYGDTLLTTFSGKIHNAGSITSWNYSKATSTLNYGKFLSVKTASLSIYRNGNHVVTCSNVPFSYSTSGNAKTYTFDLGLNSLLASGCLIYSSFNYINIDSLVLNVKYVVDLNPGNAEYQLQIDNDFYVSTVPNPSASQRYSCDNFSARLKLIGYYFTNYGSNTFNADGCSNIGISQSYYLSVGACCSNYAGGNIFPYEYRKWAKLKEIILTKPLGFDVITSNFNHSRTKSTGTIVTQYISNITPYTSTTNQLKYRTDSFYTDLGGSILLSDDGFYGTYSTVLAPNCKAADGPNYFNYAFVYQKLGFLGSGLDTLYSTNTYDIIDYNRPNLSFTVTNNYVYPEKDTVEWQIRVSNTDPKAAANNVWIGALKNANTEIVAIRDKGTNTLLPKNIDVYKLGNLASNAYKDLIVYVKYISCNTDSILLRMGYDCGQYPDSIRANPCSYYTTILKYEPINTRLDVKVLTQLSDIDLCAKQAYQIEISNTGSPKVYNTYLDLELRPGLTLSDTAWLFIDGRSDSICISGFTNLGGNAYRWNFANRDNQLDLNGLASVKSSSGYKMILKLWLTTDCNFTSSSSFLIRPGGFLKCGLPVNAPYLLADPIQIKDVVKPYYSAIDFYMNPLEVCGYQDSTYVKFINLGPEKTGSTDKFILTLPIGVLVDTSYIDTLHNAPTYTPSWDNTNGQNIFSWKIPPNISAGDSCIFKIKTSLNNSNLTCGIKKFYAQAVVTSPAFCVSSNTYCDINVATSSLELGDSAVKEAYSLSFLRAESVPSGLNEKVSMDYAITNNGADKVAGTALVVQIVYDSNANGKVDYGEFVIDTDTIWNALNAASVIYRTKQFEVLSSLSCNLLLHISTDNCVCEETTEQIKSIQLLNAGRDSILCPNEIMNLGFIGDSANSYSWNNTNYVNQSDTSITEFKALNSSTVRDTVEMILTTNKGSCSSNDTAKIIIYAGMQLNMPDSVNLCIGSSILIGDIAKGGESKLKNTIWQPTNNLSNTTGYKTNANPTQNTTYTLTVTDTRGCSISDSSSVKIKEKPNASFSFKDSCAEATFLFTNTSDYMGTVADSLHWSFDYLGESQFNTISYKIDSSLILPVQLYVSNEFACWDTLTQFVEIQPLPNPKILYTSACEESKATILSGSTITYGSITNLWVVDGISYAGDSIVTTVPTSDWTFVSLTTTSDKGCARSLSDSFVTLDKPEIALSLQDQCFLDSVKLSISTFSGTRDSISFYQWDLGDGFTSTIDSLNYLYLDTGTFTVSLIVGNLSNCMDTATASVTIYPKPISAFSVINICLGDTLSIFDSSTLSDGTRTIFWNTGIGYSTGDSTLKIIPSTIGDFTAKQIVESDKGCIDSSAQNYTIYYKEKLAQSIQGVCENTDILFSATGYKTDSVSAHRWTVNGDTLTTANFSYRFPKDSTYIIQQRIVTNRGCVSDSTYTVIIRPAPIAQIIVSKPCEDNLVKLESGTTQNQYEWFLEDGTQNTTKQFNHTFINLGTYDITLRVTNQYNCQTTINDSVNISNIVKPDFEIGNACEGDGQWIITTSKGLNTPITSAVFNMDNGTVKNEIDSFEYTYYTSGNYDISLQITTLPGCTYSITKSIVIYPLPKADFLLSPETPDIFTPEILGINNSYGADSIRYILSDGTKFFTANFAHRFLDSGNYEIQQWVRTQFGCLDSITKQLYVNFAYHLYVPNAYTPNSDALNDGFRPVALGLKSYELEIYNRWGEKIFVSSDAEPAWLGSDAETGYYLYQIKAFDFTGNVHYYKGVVHLLR